MHRNAACLLSKSMELRRLPLVSLEQSHTEAAAAVWKHGEERETGGEKKAKIACETVQ